MDPKVEEEDLTDSLSCRPSGTLDHNVSLTADFCFSSLSDVGLYSLSGLVAVSLIQLFDDDCHREFRKKTLEKILQELKQPKQVTDSMMMVVEGEVINDPSAFVDSLVKDECLKTSREPVIGSLISVAISDGHYDSRLRMLIKHVAWQLRVTWEQVEEIESDLAVSLEYNTYVMSEEEAIEKAKKAKTRKIKRYALIGLATVGGGALIGLTGGLAAPLVAAGAGVIIGGAGAAALGSAAGVAIIGSLFGVAGAGLTGYKMKRRVGAIEEFSFDPLTLVGSRLQADRTAKQLHITIAVTGWLNDKMPDFRMPWSALAESKEQYSLRWESKYLYQLGEAFDYLLQTGISMATTEALKYTVLSGLIAAITWPAALISAAGVIDNPWHVCTQRSEAAGKQLAEVLLAREQGNRPVTMIGFSMGARVIFYCLEELSKRKGSEGLIEDVILLGAPVSGDPKNWMPFSKIVAGKIVNGYSRGDWLLKFLYRTANVKLRVAGLGPVKWDNRRMHNIDLTDLIDGHGDYIKNLDIIMKAVGVRTKDELKPTVPKSGSRTIIPKSLSASTGSVSGDKSNPVRESSKFSSDDGTRTDPFRDKHRENSGAGSEKQDTNQPHTVGIVANDLPHRNMSVSGVSSRVDGHISGLDVKVDSTNTKAIDRQVRAENEAKGECAIKEGSPERNSLSSVDFTSSESEFSSKEPTPVEATPSHVNEATSDFNTNAEKLRDRARETKDFKNVKKESERGTLVNMEAKKVVRVEDEIRERIKKLEEDEEDTKSGVIRSESCYFTDSDPEGES